MSIILLAVLTGCGGWGGYVYESDHFDFKFVFPPHWEVMDRSTDTNDFLEASLLNVRGSEITVFSRPVSPDLSPHEIYPQFLEGGKDASYLKDFTVENQGTIHAKNGEGRFIIATFEKDDIPSRSLRAMFMGNRFTLEVHATMPKDQFITTEAEFRKMIAHLEI